MLKASQISFRYSDKTAWLFRGFDLAIAPGEIVGLPGPSGRGKSTLAKILAGFLRAREGSVALDGHPLPQGKFCPVQLVFQHPELAVNPRWKIRTILNEASTPSKELLKALSIDENWMERYPHELSGGELQRVCLARALDPRTQYLLCDEMTSMMDALTQASTWKAVLGIAKERTLGLLVVTHDESLIARLCKRTVQLKKPMDSGFHGNDGKNLIIEC